MQLFDEKAPGQNFSLRTLRTYLKFIWLLLWLANLKSMFESVSHFLLAAGDLSPLSSLAKFKNRRGYESNSDRPHNDPDSK